MNIRYKKIRYRLSMRKDVTQKCFEWKGRHRNRQMD